MSEDISDEELAKIEASYKATTPGEWTARDIDDITGPFFYSRVSDGNREKIYVRGWDVKGPFSLGNYEDGAFIQSDAEFIAAVHQWTPALIAAIRHLKAERAELRNWAIIGRAAAIRRMYEASNADAHAIYSHRRTFDDLLEKLDAKGIK